MPAPRARTDRLDLLRALIDHPRTPANERDAAQAMLTRLRANQAEQARTDYADTAWYGAKYDQVPRVCPTSVITKAIREEIKTIRKVAKAVSGDGNVKLHDPIGDAPADLTFSVTTPHHGSIHITIRNIPDDWGWKPAQRNDTGEVRDRPRPSDALRAVGSAVRALANAYNHDRSPTSIDYFDQRFVLHITACKGDKPYGTTIA